MEATRKRLEEEEEAKREMDERRRKAKAKESARKKERRQQEEKEKKERDEQAKHKKASSRPAPSLCSCCRLPHVTSHTPVLPFSRCHLAPPSLRAGKSRANPPDRGSGGEGKA